MRIEPLALEFWGRVGAGAVIPAQEGSRVVGYANILGFAAQPKWFSPEVAGFVEQAQQFCEFVEKPADYTLKNRLIAARARLLRLYEAGAALPRVEPPEGFDSGPSPKPPEDWAGFDQFDGYWEVFDPYENDSPVGGSLSDDLLDVYGDVQRGLRLWKQKGVPKEAAIWEWRFHFDQHGGNHAIDALRALHRSCGQVLGSSDDKVQGP